MRKFTRLMTVALFVTLNVSGVLPIANPTIQANASSYIDSGSATQSGYTTLGSYYISKVDVKAMAKTMRASTGGGAILTAALVSLLGPYPMVASVAASLSANAQTRSEVLYAADHNMRVWVVIKDQAVHTSYSTVVEYTAVY